MSKNPSLWKMLAGRYSALLPRERRIVALALLIGPALLFYLLLLEPEFKRVARLKATVIGTQQNLNDLQAQTATLRDQLQQDPDAAKKAELAKLRAEVGGADEKLKKLEESLVPPEQMNATLERLLARQPNLQLLSLKTLEPESVVPPAKVDPKAEGAAAPQARGFDLYRHGIELRLEGNYVDLHAYLAQLEREQKKLLWGRLQLEVVQYPKAHMTLVVYTLSSDKAWLAL